VQAYAEARAAGIASSQGIYCFDRGLILLWEGKPRSAVPVLAEGADLLLAHDPFWVRPLCLAYLAQAAAVLGATSQAEDALAQIERMPGQLESARGLVAQARAWLAAEAGKRREACHLLLAQARADDAVGLRSVAICLLHDAVRLGDTSCADYLSELATEADGELLPLFAAHGRALCMRRGEALALVSERFEAIGAVLYAAETAARAAVRYRRAGRKREALAWARRASQLAQRCEGARTPALALLAPPNALSPREEEVAQLVARGLTSREVARRLSVSVRTVDNQLASVYAKLGITRRSELRATLFTTP
jgi:DNA-binding CsgD family transcriptional regulator